MTAPLPPLKACHQPAGNVRGHTCSATNISPVLSCYPWSASAPTINERLFWLPAIACPQGWVASTMRTTPYRAGYTNGDAEWIAGETAITCCPTGFEKWNSGRNCRWNGTNFLTNTPCTSGSSAAETGEVSGQSTSTTTWPYAKKLRLRYQQSDLTQSLPGAPAGDCSLNGTCRGEDLSVGEKAAIGAVVPVAIIGLVAGILLIWKRRQRQPHAETSASTYTTQHNEGKSDVNTSRQLQYRNEDDLPEVYQWSGARVHASEL